MKLVVFGLSVSSSWGNGHATLWRGLCRALGVHGHQVVFFEKDVPYYAQHRDLAGMEALSLRLYPDWRSVTAEAERELRDADVGMVTSYCPDGAAATELVLGSPARVRAFYDLDTPVTLARVRAGEAVEYLGPRRLQGFDLALSYTGGMALAEMKELLGARRVAPLYGSVDPTVHRPVRPVERFQADLSYLGTYAEDRQQALEALFIEPARRMRERRFLLAGAQYPAAFPWTDNIYFVRHLPPAEHPAFFSSCRLTLNITRLAMAEMGFCPSGRLFEAAACGAPVVTDWWEGLDEFFTPGRELLIARHTSDVTAALSLPDEELARIARAARERTLDEHTANHRARELETLFESALAPLTESAGGGAREV